MISGTSGRSRGSPPVRRNLVHPEALKGASEPHDLITTHQLWIAEKGVAGPKISAGMQYGQRKLQRSVTEMRRSRSGRRRVSSGGVVGVGAGEDTGGNQSQAA
jgi:hypothetical protein